MKIDKINLKLDTEILSSRMSSEIGSSRAIFRVGQPAIYIAPKLMCEENSFYDQNSKSEFSKDSNNSLQIRPKKSEKCVEPNHMKQPSLQQKKIFVFRRLDHIGMTLVEGLIFCCFLFGSFRNPIAYIYIDAFANFVCGVKIILLHTYIYFHNKKRLQDSESKYKQQQKQPILYLNNLQLFQLLQFWSMFSTLFLFLFWNNPFATNLINTLRLVRLFFPFAALRTTRNKWKAKLFAQMIKLTVGIVFVVALAGIFLTLLMGNIDNYYCLSPSSIKAITMGDMNVATPISCGIYKQCITDSQSCLNIYSYTTTPQQKQSISKWLQKSDNIAFGNGILVTMWMVLSVDGGWYEKYRELMIEQLLFPIFCLFWLGYWVSVGVGVGEAVREESLENYRRSLFKNNNETQKDVPIVCFPQFKQSIQSQDYHQTTKQIQKQISDRTTPQKISTILFNLVYLTQVLLTILYNIQLKAIENMHRDVGIALGVIFILWSFGLGLAVYEWLTDEERWKNRVKIYTLLFEILAYSLSLADYILRASLGQYLFESFTGATPFAQAVLSLRVIFILYNNGIDAVVSYIAEKIMQNFIKMLSYIGIVLILGVSIGFIMCYWFVQPQLEAQIFYVMSIAGRVLGFDIGIQGRSMAETNINVCLKFLSIFIFIYFCKTTIVNYSKIIHFDSKEEPEEPEIEDTQQKQEVASVQLYLRTMYENQYYVKLLTAIIFVYVGVSYLFLGTDPAAEIFLFVIDWLLILDAIGRIIAYRLCGNGSYFSTLPALKILNIVTMILLIVFFFIPSLINPGIINSLRLTRSLLLVSLIPPLHQTFNLLKSFLLDPKTQIYKFSLIIVPSLILLSACLISSNLNNIDHHLDMDDSGKIVQVLGSAIGYTVGIKWVGLRQVKGNPAAFLCVWIVHACVVMLAHGIFIFMAVNYLISLKHQNEQSQRQRVLRQYCIEDPSTFFHQPTNYPTLYAYLKVLKVTIILASIVLLVLISGSSLQYSKIRQLLVTINLVLNLMEIFIYFIQNLLAKQGEWPKIEAILICISVPGSFFLMFPVIKFASYVELSILIRIFLALSIVRVFRLYSLLQNRSVFLFSSPLFRRISRYLDFNTLISIFTILFVLTLPFAALIRNISMKSFNTEIINLITGSFFIGDPISPSELIPKAIYAIFLHFPLRMLLISKIISDFLPTHPEKLTLLQDHLQKICTLFPTLSYIKLNESYRFCAQVHRAFRSLYKKENKYKVKCLGYDDMMGILGKMEVQVYCFMEEGAEGKGDGVYGVFMCDIIWYFYKIYGQIQNNQGQITSLYPLSKTKRQNITKSHFKLNQYYSWTKIRGKIYKAISQVRTKQQENAQIR